MIICAAIKIEVEDSSLVICGRRHGDCFEIKAQLADKWKHGKVTQGFIDNKGEFHDRLAAYIHAKDCGQLSATTLWYKGDHSDYELYSEDLY